MKRMLVFLLVVSLLFVPGAQAGVEFSGDYLYGMYPLLQAAANCMAMEEDFVLTQERFDAIVAHMALYGKYAVEPGEYDVREDGASFISHAMLARMAGDCFGEAGAQFASLTPSEFVKETEGGYLVYPDADAAYRNVDAYQWLRISPLDEAVLFRLTDVDAAQYDGYFLLEENADSRFGFVLKDVVLTEGEPALTPFAYAQMEDFGAYTAVLLTAEMQGEELLVTLLLQSGEYAQAHMPWYGEVTVAGEAYDADIVLREVGALEGPCALVMEDGQAIALTMTGE